MNVQINGVLYRPVDEAVDDSFWLATKSQLYVQHREEYLNGEAVSLTKEGYRFADWLYSHTSLEFREGFFAGLAAHCK